MHLQAASNVLYSDIVVLLVARRMHVSLDSLNVNMSNFSVVAVKDFSNFLQSRSASLDVENADEDEFKEDPALGMFSLQFDLGGTRRGENLQHRWYRTSMLA